jgi:hypothetical protein
MKSTTLLQVVALPAAIAANFLELYVVAEKHEGEVLVIGKKEPDAGVTQMNFTTGFNEGVLCLGDDKLWTHWGCGDDKGRPEYRQVGEFDFPEATTEPRPFVLNYISQLTYETIVQVVSCIVCQIACQTDAVV